MRKHHLFCPLSNGLVGTVSSELLYLDQEVDPDLENARFGVCQDTTEDSDIKLSTLIGSWTDSEFQRIAPALSNVTVLHFKYSDLETINKSLLYCSSIEHLVLKDCFLDSGELRFGSGAESLRIDHCDSLPYCGVGTRFKDVVVSNMSNTAGLSRCAKGSNRVFLNGSTVTDCADTSADFTAYNTVILNDCRFDVHALVSLTARSMALIECELLPSVESRPGTVASVTESLAVEAGLYKRPSLANLIQRFPNLRHLSLHRIGASVRLLNSVQKLSSLETVTIDGKSANFPRTNPDQHTGASL